MLIRVINMIKEVYLPLVYLLEVNGQNTLVHQARSIIITVSVKCHSGRNLESGSPEGHHPKILIIPPETIEKNDQVHGQREESRKKQVNVLTMLQIDIGTAAEMKNIMIVADQNIQLLHTIVKMGNHYKTWIFRQTEVHLYLRIHMAEEKH